MWVFGGQVLSNRKVINKRRQTLNIYLNIYLEKINLD